MVQYSFWLKIASLSLLCIINVYLFGLSCLCNYQHEWIKENTKFMDSMFAMNRWINSPYGKLKIYVFNVTNADEFLSGRDEKVHLEQIGPITYEITGYNEILNRTKDSVTYSKDSYRHIYFVPDESVSPNILGKIIVQANKEFLLNPGKFIFNRFHLMFSGVSEPNITLFLPSSVREFLSIIFYFLNIAKREEIFTVNIGEKHGMENFFRIQTLNGVTSIKQNEGVTFRDRCLINVEGAFDNSLFPPFITKNTSLNIMVFHLCRVIPLQYQREEIHHGLHGYRYVIMPPKKTKCFSELLSEPLLEDMFAVSRCVRMPWLEKVSTTFSAPHFYGSSYNWSEHFEGLNPKAEEHEAFILLEPTTGVKINERIRFQSNTIMPNLNYLDKLSNKIVPSFWFDFEMSELPLYMRILLYLNVNVMSMLQFIAMDVQLLGAIWSLYIIRRLILQRKF